MLTSGPCAAAERFGLIVAAGVLPHLDGPEGASRLLARAAKLLTPRGLLVLDDLGPGALPTDDLPLAIDWVLESDGRRYTRRSQLTRREAPEGLRVTLSTIVDRAGPRWYDSPASGQFPPLVSLS